MTMQRNLVQRNISVDQSLMQHPELSPLVHGIQQTLALMAEQGQAWYEVTWRLNWGGASTQMINAHAILSQASDDAFMMLLAQTVEAYEIVGVQSWSVPVTSLGYPLALVTSAQVGFSVWE